MAGLAGVVCLLLAASAVTAAAAAAEAESLSSYIVHVAAEHAPRSTRPRLLSRSYTSFLHDNLPAHMLRPAPQVFYAYAHAATGFAARLTERQAAHLASQRPVLAVVPDETMQPHTTLTPSFLGLSPSSGLLPRSNGAADVVIGVIDSGIYPMDRPSFAADASLPLPPSKFRGTCVSTPSFNGSAYCNNKLVGARFFYEGMKQRMGVAAFSEAEESLSPLDTNGHGSHTASTAAGSAGVDASFFNYGKGKAIGVAPGARIAAYKACWKHGCSGSDILMAFEAAIADGVDVISVSLGASKPKPKEFYVDGIARGSFSAVRNGITVSVSSGNFGPGEFTTVNVAPWFLTVGASTINRRFPASVVLGNGETFTGTSIYAGAPLGKAKIPLVYGQDEGFGEQALTTAHILPATAVKFADAERIKKYIRSNTSPSPPVATIEFHGTVVGRTHSSSRMASFSSRGPNLLAPEILKPDVTAPGVDILAAWTGENSPSQLDSDPRRVKYNIISGTSMSCPHVSGIAALLRQARPEWSPAAIKSALMTTAYNVDSAGDIIKDMSTGKASTPFVRGAGHVDPNRAVDPGLVYDAGADAYFSFLCAIGYTAEQIAVFRTKDDPVVDCSTRTASVGDHNYPAFSVVLNSTRDAVTQRRVVRNVGSSARATYRASFTSPAGVRVTVNPRKLRFSVTQKTQEYEITFAARGVVSVTEKYTFGSIVWSDGKHKVASPIAITWPATVRQVAAM
ncbi:subtilisin-like protease SBT1.4 [Sorghum bicolor]|jgi:subtilisin family serine protease|nr:subtilisin-like protease SBT1.4 [Sorghum bicolor]|eukprot:XP_002452917.1 subtilisin-like protease SBT1.4 [Sorghum bicolor]